MPPTDASASSAPQPFADIREMIAALERDEFELHYQPQVRIATKTVVAAEALVRWRHPTRGLLTAATFLPALKDVRFARRVGEWALWKVRADLSRWAAAGLKVVPVSVNIHPQHLAESGFARMFIEASEGLIDLEVVEEAIASHGRIAPVLEELRAAGIRIALDDFGIGYSTLGRLAELPIDILKIDQSFIAALTRSGSKTCRVRARRILATIISLGHICGFTTVAEGVENEAQLAALAELGCDASQGYLHSPAVAAQEFVRFLSPAPAGGAARQPAASHRRRARESALARAG